MSDSQIVLFFPLVIPNPTMSIIYCSVREVSLLIIQVINVTVQTVTVSL